MESYSLKMLILLKLGILISIAVVEALECGSNIYGDIEKCTSKNFQNSPGWDTKALCDFSKDNNITNTKCKGHTVCGRNFKVSIFDQQLFAITMKNVFVDMLKGCCKECTKCAIINKVEDTMKPNDTLLNSSDVLFPVLGDSSSIKMDGFYFLPAVPLPSAFYFTLGKPNSVVVVEVITACGGMWPLLLVCLLFASISGFIVWIFEMNSNEGEFSRRFHVGLFDGFWWSFVSMTTVGFGDKTPKTFLGRIYAVFWILIGITLCGMFTATLTTEIIDARIPASTELSGQNISVLKGRLHDIAIAAGQGGIIRMGTIGHTMRGIGQMMQWLEEKKVRGFIIDRNTYYHFVNRMNEKKYQYLKKKWKELDLIKTEKVHEVKTLSCGILLRKYEDYEYFKGHFENNYLDLSNCNAIRMSVKSSSVSQPTGMFSSDGNLFISLMTYSVILLLIMILIGLIIELLLHFRKTKPNDSNESNEMTKLQDGTLL